MRNLVLILILVGLMLIPLGGVSAQDNGTAVSQPSLVEETATYAGVFLIGTLALVGVFLGLALIIGVGVALTRYIWADNQLAAFGRTPTGRLIYSGLGTVYDKIDSPDDPAIQTATATLKDLQAGLLNTFNLVLPVKPELLTEKEVSEAARVTVNGLQELFNGVGLPSNLSAQELLKQLRD